jgi:hypothetical protein
VVTFGGSGYSSAGIFAFNDIHSAAPFDANGAIPNTPNNASCSFTTSNANDILIGMGVSNQAIDSEFTELISGSINLFAECESVTATQSSTPAIGTFKASVCDAIIQGP